ncbi:MAG TPA: iron-containing redox enzyme family protein, partial [Ilumatobacteraceae bacterium]|nr:iron-containing redox enzyme family protein [Ilumatobacteraceae bacterium]
TGTLEQMRELIVHRSPYQLKEGDPHTAGVQRLNGRAKQILVQIQAGEYGADAPGRRTHAALFADTMCSLGLDPTPNAYLDVLPASSLAISNLISMFGFNRRWRGSLVGQLAAFEMTSVIPMGRYAAGLLRMGAPDRARRFYDVHVMADAEHEVMAIDMVEQQCTLEPTTADDVVFGVQSTLVVERWFAETLLRTWRLLPGELAEQHTAESRSSTDALMTLSVASGRAPRPAHRMQSSQATRGRPLRTQ